MNARLIASLSRPAALLATLAGAALSHAQCAAPQKLIADSPQAWEYFANALTLNQTASGPVLIAGSPFDDTPVAQNSGSFYAFLKSGNTWSQTAHLYPGDLQTDAQFGTSVSFDDPYLIVGAPNIDTPNGADIGAFYVYERSGNSWTNKGRQTPVWSQGPAHAGAAVAITADNGGWALVGSPDQDWTAPNPDSGAAYFYKRLADGSWGYIQGVWDYNAAGSGANQWLGQSVAIKGDTAVIAAPHGKAAGGANYSGFVKVFRRNANNGGWTISGPDRLVPADLGPLAYFGQKVATDGTYIAVSATGMGSTASETPGPGAVSQAGCIYVYRWNGSAFVQDGKIFADDPATAEYMGGSLAVSGGRIYAGSYASRKVRVFRRLAANQWTQEAVYGTPAGAEAQGFAAEVAVDGSNLVIGHAYEDAPGNLYDAGSAYAYAVGVQNGNDACDGATAVASGVWTGCTTSASRDGASSCGQGGPGGPGPDVWYAWTPSCSGNVIIDTVGSAFDTVLSVHSDCPVPNGPTNTITCNDDAQNFGAQSLVTFDYAAGVRYLIRVAGYNGAAGAFTLRINEYETPANNLCSAPAKAARGTTAFKTCRSTTDGPTNAAGCAGIGNLANDVWFRHRAISGSPTTITTFGSTFDTILQVFPGLVCPANNAQAIACNDDASIFNSRSSVTFSPVAGQDYLIRVGGYNGATGDGQLNITPSCPCDYNGVNGTDLLDIFAFLEAWFAGSASTDFNGQNGTDLLDIFDFLGCWFSGCA